MLAAFSPSIDKTFSRSYRESQRYKDTFMNEWCFSSVWSLFLTCSGHIPCNNILFGDMNRFALEGLDPPFADVGSVGPLIILSTAQRSPVKNVRSKSCSSWSPMSISSSSWRKWRNPGQPCCVLVIPLQAAKSGSHQHRVSYYIEPTVGKESLLGQ